QALHTGQVPRILLIERRIRRLQRLGILPSEVDSATRQLRKLGVPEDALVILPGQAVDDWAALRQVGDWLSSHPDAKLTLICDSFGSRRLSYIIHHVLGADASRVRLHPLVKRHYNQTDWWQTRAGVNTVAMAYLRLGYAWLADPKAEEEWRESDLAAFE